MHKQIKTGLTLLVVGCCVGTLPAEFGVSAGGAFNMKARFGSTADTLQRANDPGAATAGTDHTYDDGYNRVDSSGNAGGLTSDWGYQNSSQYNPAGDGSIRMNSAQTIINPAASSASQDTPQPAISVYWQQDLTKCAVWNLGVRAAFNWQRINLDAHALEATTSTTISDTYSLGGVTPPGAPFNGSYAGPNPLLGDDPSLTRSISSAAGPTLLGSRSIDGDLFGLDLGPTLSVNITDHVRAVFSAGATLAWIRSDFSYNDGALASGSTTDDKALFGGYAGADLQYRICETWGVFVGATHTHLENFTQQAQGHTAELKFNGCYDIHTGVYFNY